MIRVLFVCHGNICRSPMAEGVFRQLVKEAGFSSYFEIDSAGTSGYHVGEAAHHGTLNVLKRNGIAYNGRSRKFIRRDVDDYDYILAMDMENFDDISYMVGENPRVTMFLADANAAGTVSETEVPDPYYTGGFDQVYAMVHAGSKALLARIRAEKGI